MRNTSANPDRLFADAQHALAEGRGAEAVRLLDQLPASFSGHPDILHLRALALKRAGLIPEARAAFVAAQRADPRNPQVLNNHANLLLQASAPADALPLYEAALSLQPGYRDAAFNRGLCLQGLGRLTEALAAIDALILQGPTDARAHSARGTILLAMDRYDDAALAFDASLQTGQALPKALLGRARVALERGEAHAVPLYRAARDGIGDDPDVILGLADALEAEGDPGGMSLLSDAVAARPGWLDGLERLAQMRAEAGDADFTAHYQPALLATADQRQLRLSLAKMLAAADHYEQAIGALAPLGDAPDIRIVRAYYYAEAGAAQDGFASLAGVDGPDAGLIEGRLALANGDFGRAEIALDRAAMAAPESVAIWANRELLWRTTDNPRAHWLSGQDNLVAARSIGLSGDDIADVAAVLRSLHRTHAFPIGQSLRGGTQTRGRLVRRQEPSIRMLRQALEAAVADHVRALPPVDPAHPLLRHRDSALTIAGSWSVRLTTQGFHVAHIHPEGLLSSACYFELPPGIANDPDQAGWLEVGRPPAALNLNLPPLATICPAPGRLALFPSYLYHGTRPFADGERLTVAFDVVVK